LNEDKKAHNKNGNDYFKFGKFFGHMSTVPSKDLPAKGIIDYLYNKD
jgi:hypothetical protein